MLSKLVSSTIIQVFGMTRPGIQPQNPRLDPDPELGACFFHKRRRELGEYSANGGDQAGFGVVGDHVGDILDV